MKGTTFFPEIASQYAFQVDAIYWGLVAVTVFFTLLVTGLVLHFSIRFQRKHKNEVGQDFHENKLLELIWSGIPLAILLVFFFWGTSVYLKSRDFPKQGIEISAVGKQWMWKFQHPDGRREINDLHVPVGKPIIMKMISQDVIHSLFLPSLRVKQDVLPMYYTKMWFQADKVGVYHLFCTEYCGKDHSEMIGRLYVMSDEDYTQWLKGANASATLASYEAPETEGEQLFNKFGCISCHAGENLRGPKLEGVFGNKAVLKGGQQVTIDENYLRESILNPTAKIVDGYEPLMPTYQGMVSEDELLQLISYIKSLGKKS